MAVSFQDLMRFFQQNPQNTPPMAPQDGIEGITVTAPKAAPQAPPRVPLAPIPQTAPKLDPRSLKQAQMGTDPGSYPQADPGSYPESPFFQGILGRNINKPVFNHVVKPLGTAIDAGMQGLSSLGGEGLNTVARGGNSIADAIGVDRPWPYDDQTLRNKSMSAAEEQVKLASELAPGSVGEVGALGGIMKNLNAARKASGGMGQAVDTAMGVVPEMGRDAGAVRMGGGKAPKSVNENIPKSFVQKLSDADLDQQIAEGFRKEGGFMGGDADALNKGYMKELQAEKLLRTPVSPELAAAPKRPPSPLAPQEVMPVDQFALNVDRTERAVSKGRLTPAEAAQAAALADEYGVSRASVRASFSKLKTDFPTKSSATDAGWSPLEVVGIERDASTKKILTTVAGDPILKVKEQPYGFHRPIGAEEERMGALAYDNEHLDSVASRLVDETKAVADRAAAGDANAIAIMGNRSWYKEMRNRLRLEYGGFADTLADTLGTTSAQTGVRQNWENAVEVLSQFSKGAYDRALGKLDDFVKAGGEMGSSGTKNGSGYINMHQAAKEAAMPNALKQAAAEGINDPKRLAERAKEIAFQTAQAGDYPIITKGDGKTLFNANSPATMMALLDKFRDFSAGGSPKTPNFTGNLIGYSDKATIDLWAARLLRRLSGRQRIPTGAEPGVKGEFTGNGLETNGEFGFGQEAFRRAATQLRNDPRFNDLGDDDLQAIAWFMEKELWGKNSWTNKVGEGGSLENEANYAGFANRDRLKEIRNAFETDPLATERRNIAKALSDPKEYEAAKAELAGKEWMLNSTAAQRRNELMGRLGIPDKAQAQTMADQILKTAREASKTIKGYEGKQERLKTLIERGAQTKAQAGRDLEAAKSIIDRWAGGLSPETTNIPATPEMFAKGQYDLSQELNADPLVVMHKALPSRGRYVSPAGKVFDENSYDMEFLTRKGFDPSNVWREMVKQAKDRNQESVFLSKVVKPGTVPTANPGIEVWFKSTLKDADVEALIAKMHKAMPDVGFTFVSNLRGKQRLSGGANTGEYVGLRAQYIPEYGGGVEGAEAARDKLAKAVFDVQKYDGVSNAKYVEYDTQVSTGAAEHDRHINGLLPTGREAGWRGQSRSQIPSGADPYAGSEPGSVGGGNLRDGGKGPNP